MGSSEKLSSNLWLAIPIERANSCSSFLLFQITMFKFIVLSSLVMMLCIDSVFPLIATSTVTTTTTKYSTTSTTVVTESLCIKSSANIAACRRRRGILYDIGNEQADQYMFNGFRIVPVSSLPRIQADPIGFENLQEQHGYFLSGEPYIKTSWRDNSASQSGLNRAMPRIFFGSLLSNLFSAVTVTAATTTTVVEQLLTTTSTSFNGATATITANCIISPYAICAFQQEN